MTRTTIETVEHGVRIVSPWDEVRLFFRTGQKIYEWLNPHTDDFPSAPYDWPGKNRHRIRQVCGGLRHTGTPVAAGEDLLATIRREWKRRPVDAGAA